MKLEDFERAVREHSGEFHCELIGKRKKTKVVNFSHLVIPPGCTESIPDVGRLRDFYDTFGSVVLYYDEKSGDAARHISSPSEWAELHAEFSDWLDMVDDEDDEDALPQWAKSCLVIGEVPQSGNYILMATQRLGRCSSSTTMDSNSPKAGRMLSPTSKIGSGRTMRN